MNKEGGKRNPFVFFQTKGFCLVREQERDFKYHTYVYPIEVFQLLNPDWISPAEHSKQIARLIF
jgi:hypothetical protein